MSESSGFETLEVRVLEGLISDNATDILVRMTTANGSAQGKLLQ